MRKLKPALTVRPFDVLSFDEGALVQQWDPVALIREAVELFQKCMPRRVIRTRMNRID